ATRAGTPTRCTRGVVVDPGAPGGLPATITTASPGPAEANRRGARSTSSNISPVCGTAVTGFTRTPTAVGRRPAGPDGGGRGRLPRHPSRHPRRYAHPVHPQGVGGPGNTGRAARHDHHRLPRPG